MSDGGVGELLEGLAPLLRVRPTLDDFCRFGGGWESRHDPTGPEAAQFHIVTRGHCRLTRPGQAELALSSGDILLLPHGDSHVVRSAKNGPAFQVETAFRNAIRTRTSVDTETDTELICGRLAFEAGTAGLLASALPESIVIRSGSAALLTRFRTLLAEIREELDSGEAGADLVATDLASALFVMLLRLHLNETPQQGSALSLLKDRTTAKVLLALLKEPAKDWSLDEMAERGATSRATLVRSFRKVCGVAPATFLGDLRLELAHQRLAGTSEPIARIAAAVGYQSEGALSKAFLRKFGQRPGALRG